MTIRGLCRGLILLAALAYSFSAWATPEATFEQGRKVVAKVSCAVKESGEKYSADAIVYANAAITEIRFAGQSQVITFAPITTSNPSKSPSTSSGDR